MTILSPTRRREQAHRPRAHRRDQVELSAGLCRRGRVASSVDGPIAGTSVRTPSVTNVALGPPIRLTVMMLPGQVPDQLRYAAHLIAPHLGGKALRVEDRGHGWCIVTLLAEDPLDGVLPLRFPSSGPGVLIGQDENGDDIRLRPVELPHFATQGQTRCGKARCSTAWLRSWCGTRPSSSAGSTPPAPSCARSPAPSTPPGSASA